MLNILQTLFLIFGWIYNIKGLVITALVIDAWFLICNFYELGKKHKVIKLSSHICIGWQAAILALSIIKLVMM